MRNWNLYATVLQPVLSWILTLPMRNWNSSRKKFLPDIGKAFWLYLWGIETLFSTFFCVITEPNFDSTYEELKPTASMLKWLSTIHFDSTYEELKLFLLCSFRRISFAFWLYLWGIETIFSGKRYHLPHFILTLPMRNWNLPCLFIHRFPDIVFWLYLWGIETHNFPSHIPLPRSLFWLYLWGIETHSKPSKAALQCLFWLYLWGIETETLAYLRNALQNDYAFWLYLWGIETYLIQLLVKSKCVFWLYLWGIARLR